MVTYLSCVTVVSFINYVLTNIILLKKHLLNKKNIIKILIEFTFIWMVVSALPKSIILIDETLNIDFKLSVAIAVLSSILFIYISYFLVVKKDLIVFFSKLNVNIKKNLKKIKDYIKKEIEEETEDERDEILRKKISDIKNNVGSSGFSDFLDSFENEDKSSGNSNDNNYNYGNDNNDNDDNDDEEDKEENIDNKNKKDDYGIDDSKSILEDLLENHSVKIGAVDHDSEDLSKLSNENFRGIDELMKDDESNTSDLEEFDESLNDNLEGILENSNLIEENSEDTIIIEDEKEEKENIKIDNDKQEDIDEVKENNLDVNSNNILNEINEITGENIDSKELEESLIEELDKYEESSQEYNEVIKDSDNLESENEIEDKMENDIKTIVEEDKKEILNIETNNLDENETVELKDSEAESINDNAIEDNSKENRTVEDIKNEFIKVNEDTDSFLGSEVKKLLSEELGEGSDNDEDIEIEKNDSKKEVEEKNEIKVENDEIKPKLKDNDNNLQFNGTFDSIESENKKSENQVNELLDLAFKQKTNEDYQGAIESFTQALDVITEDQSDEVVFWIVLDICILYKQLGQGELAKEILNGYYSEYKGLMSEEIRMKIENNL